MNKTVISPLIFLIIQIYIVTASQQLQQCPLTQDQPHTQILNQHSIPCLQKALRHNWQKVIQHIIQQQQPSQQQKLIQILQQQLKRLQILQQQIILGTSQTQPILKWGQNRTHIFMTFKLSHRWDSPPCLYTQQEYKRLEQDLFVYENICVVSHQKINFKIDLNLNKKVFLSFKDNSIKNKNEQTGKKEEQSSDQGQSSQGSLSDQIRANFTGYVFDVKKDGVGQYSTILLKQVPQVWTFLTKQQKGYPTWHEISTRYPEEFNEYEQKQAAYKIIQRQKAASTNSSSSSQSVLVGRSLVWLLSLLIAFIFIL